MPFNSILNSKKGHPLSTRFLVSVLMVLCLSNMAPTYAFHFPWDQGHDTTDPEDPEDPGPCEGGECENDPCNGGSQGSPVYLATGHFIWDETDVVLKGRPDLSINRTFNSHDPRIGLLGSGWSMSCDQGLIFTVRYENSGTVIDALTIREYVRRFPNGKRYIYSEQSNGTFVAPGVFDVVRRQPDRTARLEKRDGSYNLYAETGQLISEVDRNGNAVNYTYDTQGNLTQKADTNGRSFTYEYNANGLVSIIRDHTGREWQYGYDDNANLVSVTDPLNGVRRYEYEQYQPEGDGQTYSHLTKVTDESGVVETEVTYDGIQVSSYKELENTFAYTYDRPNRKTTKTDSQGSTWVFTYNNTGQFTRIEAPLDRTTLYERDLNSLITKITDPSGTEYSFTYDRFSNRLTQTDERGTITTEYDEEKPWPLRTTSRTGRITEIDYDSSGNPLTAKDPAEQVTTFLWNAQGDLLEVINPLTNKTAITYSSQGLPLSVTDPLSRPTLYQYDVLNNIAQITNPLNETRQYQYDALDRLITHIDGNGDTTNYTYDAADRITRVTAPNGQTVQYLYDGFGRLSQRVFYDGTQHNYQYRNDNLVAQITRPDNVVISMIYDDAKRLIQKTIGSEDTYIYAYNSRDELTSVTNSTGTVTLEYDGFGRKITEVVNSETVGHQYNTEDEITQTISLGITQTQQFDIRGLLSRLDVSGTNYQYIYDALARLIALNRDSVDNTIIQYNSTNEITQIDHGVNQRNHQYQYDFPSRITQWQGISNETKGFEYDNASRLTNVSSISNPEAFNYDSLGNRQNNNAQFDMANRITEDDNYTYLYDVNGNRTQKTNKITGEVERYTYNSLDQLIRYHAYPDGEATTAPITDYSYLYGPLGRRWSKQNNLVSETTLFYWSNSSLIGENNSGILRRYVLEGLSPVAFVENGEIYHYLKDHVGTAHEIIDSSGNIVWQGDYNSFGEVIERITTIENNLRFVGQYSDRESGLFYNYFRNYDPFLGSYIQSDSIGLAGGLNTYIYVEANPINFIDPTGEAALNPASGAVGGFALGGPVGAAVGALIGTVAIAVIGNGIYEMAKGGKQNVKDTGLIGVPTDEIERKLKDPATSSKEKKRLEKELKARKERNKKKRCE